MRHYPELGYIIDNLEVLNSTDGTVPSNDIQLGVGLENEGAEYNAPIKVCASSDDDWSFEDSFLSEPVVIPGETKNKYVVLKGELTKVEEGKTYELYLKDSSDEYISPTDKNSVYVKISAPTTSVKMTVVGKGIIFSNNTVSAASASQISLFDINGSLINSVDGSKLSMENISKGCYLVRVNGENGTEVKKIIVK